MTTSNAKSMRKFINLFENTTDASQNDFGHTDIDNKQVEIGGYNWKGYYNPTDFKRVNDYGDNPMRAADQQIHEEETDEDEETSSEEKKDRKTESVINENFAIMTSLMESEGDDDFNSAIEKVAFQRFDELNEQETISLAAAFCDLILSENSSKFHALHGLMRKIVLENEYSSQFKNQFKEAGFSRPPTHLDQRDVLATVDQDIMKQAAMNRQISKFDQDGGQFYDTSDGQLIASAPFYVRDGDMDAAIEAREWFLQHYPEYA